MADAAGGHHRSTTWSVVSEQVGARHPTSKIPSNRLATAGSSSSLDRDHEKTLSVSKSRRTLRQSRSMIPERKAYPLPDPSQFETPAAAPAPMSSSSSSSDPTNDILYPMQSLKRFAERERDTSKPSQQVVTSPRDVPLGEKQPASQPLASFHVGLKQPAPPDKAPAVTEPVLGSLPSKEVPSTGDSSILPQVSKVVVVYDAEKKFSTAAVDFALKEFATAEGDAIVVVAFLEHVVCPLGMKMVADLQQFSGVNENIIKQTVLLKKTAIESKLRNTNRSQLCEMKKIQLDVRVLPGSNPKALVAKEIIDFQATHAIFDKNAMQNRRYYEENVSCHVLRLRGDGRNVETISLFSQGAAVDKTGSTTSLRSDSSSDSGSMNSDSPTLWSKLKRFGSKRSSGSLRHSTGSLRHSTGSLRDSPGSVIGSSRTSSNLGSPRHYVQEEDEPVAEVLEESFSFPNPAKVYVYAAPGFDHEFGSHTRSRNGESNNLPTALTA